MNNFQSIVFKDGDLSLNVAIKDNTGWLSQSQIATLFGVSQPTISRKMKSTYNVLINDESSHNSNLCRIEYLHPLENPNAKKKVAHYSIDFIEELNKPLNNNLASKCINYIKGQLFALSYKEDLQNNLVTFVDGNICVDVSISPEEETVWMSQDQIARLFDTTRPNVSLHIKNIVEDGELDYSSISKNFLHMGVNGQKYSATLFNLDLILAVGYRIKGSRAIQFRRWATNILKEYLIKGYVLNYERLQFHSDCIIRLENSTELLKKEIAKIRNYVGFTKSAIFNKGDTFEAYVYIRRLIKSAQDTVVIIDPYFDNESLSYVEGLKDVIKKKIYLAHNNLMDKTIINKFKEKNKNVEFYNIKQMHDRFIIIDNEQCYMLGTSLNQTGKMAFAINEIENKTIIASILSKANESNQVFNG